MPEPTRIYEQRNYPIGWQHRCENPECDKVFTSKRKARFCSAACRISDYRSQNRIAREYMRARQARRSATGQ
jgi:hypothetical protein